MKKRTSELQRVLDYELGVPTNEVTVQHIQAAGLIMRAQKTVKKAENARFGGMVASLLGVSGILGAMAVSEAGLTALAPHSLGLMASFWVGLAVQMGGAAVAGVAAIVKQVVKDRPYDLISESKRLPWKSQSPSPA